METSIFLAKTFAYACLTLGLFYAQPYIIVFSLLILTLTILIPHV